MTEDTPLIDYPLARYSLWKNPTGEFSSRKTYVPNTVPKRRLGRSPNRFNAHSINRNTSMSAQRPSPTPTL